MRPSDGFQLPASATFADEDDVVGLLERAQSGSQPAVARLLEICRGYLLLVANREAASDIRQKFAASDLVQESLAEAWQGFGRFSGQSEAELLAWLRRILLNNLANAACSLRETAKRDIAREISLDDGKSNALLSGQLVAADASPSGCAVELEEQECLFRALGRLPAHYAQVIRLRNLEYLSFVDIANRMQLSSDSARKLWERAVEHLANELRPSNVHP